MSNKYDSWTASDAVDRSLLDNDVHYQGEDNNIRELTETQNEDETGTDNEQQTDNEQEIHNGTDDEQDQENEAP